MIKLHLPYPSVWGLYDGWGAKRRLSPTYTKWRTDASFFIKVEADTRQELLPLAIRRAHHAANARPRRPMGGGSCAARISDCLCAMRR